MEKYIILSITLLIIVFSNQKVTAQVTQTEFDALKTLYKSTNGGNWTDNTGWDTTLTASDVTSSWYGLTVSGGHVTRVELPGNNLAGEIPPEIGNLNELQYLVLSGTQNQLTGHIPQSIGNLNKLVYFYAWGNSLEGPLPDEIGNLTNLKVIDLASNKFEGKVPDSFINLEKLNILSRSWNDNFTELPDLSNLPALDILRLDGNAFTFEYIELYQEFLFV
jgi:hypothetical protein